MKFILFSISFLFTLPLSHAQENPRFGTGFIVFNNQRVQTIEITLPYDQLDVEKAFVNWMRDEYDYGLDGGKILELRPHSFSALSAIIPEVSDRPLDLFLRTRKDIKDRTILTIYASLGFDTWINGETFPFEFRVLTGIFKDFVYKYIHAEVDQDIAMDDPNIQ